MSRSLLKALADNDARVTGLIHIWPSRPAPVGDDSARSWSNFVGSGRKFGVEVPEDPLDFQWAIALANWHYTLHRKSAASTDVKATLVADGHTLGYTWGRYADALPGPFRQWHDSPAAVMADCFIMLGSWHDFGLAHAMACIEPYLSNVTSRYPEDSCGPHSEDFLYAAVFDHHKLGERVRQTGAYLRSQLSRETKRLFIDTTNQLFE